VSSVDLERVPFLDDWSAHSKGGTQHFVGKGIWRWLGVFISIVVGAYAGRISQTMQEGWLYAASFCGEGLVCACVSWIVGGPTFKRSIFTIGTWFTISGAVTPIACWISLALLSG
jgi:hypothetical protein